MNHSTQEFEQDPDLSFQSSPEDPIKYINVYKHLSEANPLLQKIQFEHYHVNVLIPVLYHRLPRELRDTSKHQGETNMSKLEDAMFNHQRMKQRMDRLLEKIPEAAQGLRGTLFDRYMNMAPVYRKLVNFDRRYFATIMVDLKTLNRNNRLPHLSHPITNRADAVEFESNFQSGNLYHAYQVSENHYELVLQNDINTRGYNQWFFFRVRNVAKGRTLRFSIVNLIKRDSLFNYGMKPAVFSRVRYEKRKIGWLREGQRISYQPNMIKRESQSSTLHTLSFQYKFPYENDTVFFSHSYPYTYSDLSYFLTSLFSSRQVGKYVTLKNLGRSVGKNKMDKVIIGRNWNKSKKVVWVLARQHPGEVTSSYMVEGMLAFMTGESRLAEYLRSNVVIKVVPMVNPDGVIHGNTRCEVVGNDPNRRWKDPNKYLHPLIYHIRKCIEKGSNVDMVLDLHSHSRKLGTFFYGNSLLHQPEASRVLPLLVCKNDKRFSFQNSRFSSGNPTTARSALFKLLKIPKVYTVQSSFYAYESGSDLIQYLPQDYRGMGRSLLQNYAYLLLQQNPPISPPLTSSKKIEDLKEVLEELEQPEVIQMGDKESVGSDSNPSEDQLNYQEIVKILPRKIEIKKKKRIVSRQKIIEKSQKTEKIDKRQYVIEREAVMTSCTSQIKKKVSQFIRKNVQSHPLKQPRTPSQKLPSNEPVIPPIARSTPLHELSKHTQTDLLEALLPFNRPVQSNLCVVGLKVEEKEVWLGDSEVGTQTLITKPPPPKQKQFLMARGSLRAPRFFNVMKENSVGLRESSLKRG